MRPYPMVSQMYSYPPQAESTVYLLPGQTVVVNERPLEQEEGDDFKKYLSLAVEALKAVANIISAYAQ
jgi:hypothetical protein